MRPMRRNTWLSTACCAWLFGCQGAPDAEPRHLHAALLRAAARPSFDADARAEQHDSDGGFFRVHYARQGTHAVPARDADADGVPDFVNTVAADFDAVLAFYTELGYHEPTSDADLPGENGGDGRFDVYLRDFPNAGADGQFVPDDACAAEGCSGYMMLENDFVGRGYDSIDLAIRLVASHELFHAVQQTYASDLDGWLSEGTAVWASEAFDAEAGDLERQAPTYLARPQSSLATSPPGTDPIRYGGGLFFEFIDEHAERQVLLEMWERLADAGTWPLALDAALRQHDRTLAQEFGSFVEWNLFTAERADPERAYAQGELLPAVNERAVDWGYRDDAVRVLPLSARYYAVDTDSAQTLSAAAILPDDVDAADLGLFIAVEHEGRIAEVQRADAERERLVSVSLEAGDTAHVALFGTRSEGGSVQPDVCIGTPDQAMACSAGDDEVDEPSDSEDAGRTQNTSDGGGCSVTRALRSAPARGAASWWTMGAWVAAGLIRRRLRRA